jgi:hypothetical protein
MDDLLLVSVTQGSAEKGQRHCQLDSPRQAKKFPGKRPKFASKRSDTSDLSSERDSMSWVQRRIRLSAPSLIQRLRRRSENF